MDFKKIADILLPNIDKTPEYYEGIYPQRNLPQGAMVTRFAPSPTGFLHIGGLLAALVNRKLANQSQGVAFLRIEDTDKKREIEKGVEIIVSGLKNFDIQMDEGMIDDNNEIGNYGPYKQSERAEIYQTFVKDLIKSGDAYPCFCSHEELDAVRAKQEKLGLRPGYYGQWAKDRELSFEEIEKNINEGKTFVIRLKSTGKHENSIKFTDLIKGEIEMSENDQDVVILKSDGLPTYHFAHAVDDHLMRTTHVIRGDEWLSSVPLHIELFNKLGWNTPNYAHIGPVVKIDGNSRRKLSKRKDPEATVSYYYEQGYYSKALIEYLLTVINSNFEEWRMENPTAVYNEFNIVFDKMSVSGSLVDINKLLDISKNIIATMNADEIYNTSLEWAKEYDKELAELMSHNEEYTKSIFSIERNNEKPRKDIGKWSDIRNTISFFFDELFEKDTKDGYIFDEKIQLEEIQNILAKYIEVYNPDVDQQTWFNDLKELSTEFGYCSNVKEYKKNPGAYKGHIGDFAGIFRIALANRKNTPDLYEMMQTMGYDRVIRRLKRV